MSGHGESTERTSQGTRGSYNDDQSSDEDSLADPTIESSNVMMSIFASYYGIDEQNNRTPGSEGPSHISGSSASARDIDSVHFNPDLYCKELLLRAPIDELLSCDIKMMHEIRALDSDMQMLVYENYNKFISATETIKRMKTNVEAMDGDMVTVQSKMDVIAKSSVQLDASLEAKHNRIDKLVRVRRVLERLEFLSELPEKLSSMIHKEEYQRAVQLYRRTIHVLTQHSQVLSFRKIKERTESMMADLRGKVTDLIEDPNLEAVKLTQYASILRLMEANRQQVCARLLEAHRQRSVRMIRQFTVTLSSVADANALTMDDSTLSSSADKAKRFHQDLIIGLIETCKGLHELYSASPASLAFRKQASRDGSGSPRGRTSSSDSALGSSEGQLSLPKEDPITPEEIMQAISQFQSLLREALPSYKTCLVNAANAFFDRYNKCAEAHQTLQETTDNESDDNESSVARSIRASQLQLFDLDDERQAWIMLIRQTIMDCKFCDKQVADCLKELSSNLATGSYDEENKPLHSADYSTTMLFVLDSHLQQCVNRRVHKFVATLPKIEIEISNAFKSVCGKSRTLKFPGNTPELCKAKSTELAEGILQALSEFCADAKEIVEVYAAVDNAGFEEYLVGCAQAWVMCVCKRIESACGVIDGDDIGDLVAANSGSCGSKVTFTPSSQRFPNGNSGLRNMIMYCALGTVNSAAFIMRIAAEWEGLGARWPGFTGRVQTAANNILQAFIEFHAERTSIASATAVMRCCPGGDVSVQSISQEIIDLVLDIDRLAAMCSIILGEDLKMFAKVRNIKLMPNY